MKKFLGADGLEFGVFADMLEQAGDYFPFCCSYCGESGCDNIFAPIRCFHKADEIILVLREPLQEQCLVCEKESDCKFDSIYYSIVIFYKQHGAFLKEGSILLHQHR